MDTFQKISRTPELQMVIGSMGFKVVVFLYPIDTGSLWIINIYLSEKRMENERMSLENGPLSKGRLIFPKHHFPEDMVVFEEVKLFGCVHGPYRQRAFKMLPLLGVTAFFFMAGIAQRFEKQCGSGSSARVC